MTPKNIVLRPPAWLGAAAGLDAECGSSAGGGATSVRAPHEPQKRKPGCRGSPHAGQGLGKVTGIDIDGPGG
jgi:hypothetical protein